MSIELAESSLVDMHLVDNVEFTLRPMYMYVHMYIALSEIYYVDENILFFLIDLLAPLFY